MTLLAGTIISIKQTRFHRQKEKNLDEIRYR